MVVWILFLAALAAAVTESVSFQSELVALEIGSRNAQFGWTPPLISSPDYQICTLSNCRSVSNQTSNSRTGVIIRDLLPYTDYQLIASTGGNSTEYSFQTDIDAPEGDLSPRIRLFEGTSVNISWNKPTRLNAPQAVFELYYCFGTTLCSLDRYANLPNKCFTQILMLNQSSFVIHNAATEWASVAAAVVAVSCDSSNSRKFYGRPNYTECLSIQEPEKTRISVTSGSTNVSVEILNNLTSTGNFPVNRYSVELCLHSTSKCKIRIENSPPRGKVVFTDLEPLTSYTVRVVGFNNLYYSKPLYRETATSTITTRIGKPQGKIELIESSNVPAGLHIRWNKPAKPYGDLDGYHVSYCQRNIGCWENSTNIHYSNCQNATTTVNSLDVPPKSAWVSIDVWVAAFNVDKETGERFVGDSWKLACSVVTPPNGLKVARSMGEKPNPHLEWALSHQIAPKDP